MMSTRFCRPSIAISIGNRKRAWSPSRNYRFLLWRRVKTTNRVHAILTQQQQSSACKSQSVKMYRYTCSQHHECHLSPPDKSRIMEVWCRRYDIQRAVASMSARWKETIQFGTGKLPSPPFGSFSSSSSISQDYILIKHASRQKQAEKLHTASGVSNIFLKHPALVWTIAPLVVMCSNHVVR